MASIIKFWLSVLIFSLGMKIVPKQNESNKKINYFPCHSLSIVKFASSAQLLRLFITMGNCKQQNWHRTALSSGQESLSCSEPGWACEATSIVTFQPCCTSANEPQRVQAGSTSGLAPHLGHGCPGVPKAARTAVLEHCRQPQQHTQG